MSDTEAIDIEPVNRELDLTVGQRLAIGFGSLLLVILAFAIGVFTWHAQSASAQRAYTERIAPLTKRADALERSLLYVGVAMRSYLLVPEPHRLSNYHAYAEQTRRALALLIGSAALPDSVTDIREISETTQAYLEATGRLIEIHRNGPLSAEDEAASSC